MAKKLLVKTPKTIDGRTLIYDDNKQVVYGQSIVELAARPLLEAQNAKRPTYLKHEFSIIDVEEQIPGMANVELKAKLKTLEELDEKEMLLKRISDLESKLGAKSDATQAAGEAPTEATEDPAEDEELTDGAGTTEEKTSAPKPKKTTGARR